ncbi:MAG: MFS transporter [Saprospiraceae bacterium]|nr:MFS transporter [Saprospiraceae bacterium]
MEYINRNRLFLASCTALVVTSMTFAIRAGMINPLGVQFGLSNEQLGWIASMAFLGFPIAVIIGGLVVDIIGMGRLMVVAFIAHLAGILLTIFASDFWTLLISTLLIGLANGTVEAACNPLVATLYPENKTTKLNHFHVWFPGGIVIGGLIVYFMNQAGLNWQWQMSTMFLPLLAYGYLFGGQRFPVTERVAVGVSTSEMYSAVVSPLFLFMVLCMFGTAITELGTNQWIDVLLKKVTDSPILILVMVSGIMALGRSLAEPVVHRFSPPGVLLASAILAALGLYAMSIADGATIFAAAAIFALGVTYFWPTMLGFVSEYIHKSGAVGLAVIGAAGMFATFIFQPVIGAVYDAALAQALPAGAELAAYKAAAAGSTEAAAYADAQVLAGPSILRRMAFIPVALTVAFGVLFFMRKRLEHRRTRA